jgi:hypothetical protein
MRTLIEKIAYCVDVLHHNILFRRPALCYALKGKERQHSHSIIWRESANTETTSRAGVRVRGYGWYRPRYEARYAGRRMLSGLEIFGLDGEAMVVRGELSDEVIRR